MGQVLRNFVSNALKFTPSGGTIKVDIRTGDLKTLRPEQSYLKKKASQKLLNSSFVPEVTSSEWIEISVTDTGVGIAPENLQRVFNEIIQFNPNQDQGGNGSGLGMYISKGIAELHGGSVSVQSDGLDKGTRFCVWLPLTSVTVPCSSSSVAFDNNGSSIREGYEVTKYIPVPLRKRSILPIEVKSNSDFQFLDIESFHPKNVDQNFSMCELIPPLRMEQGKGMKETLAGLKMLMVDDSVTNLKVCVKLFTRLGADVDSAIDGSIAVEMVRAKLAMAATSEHDGFSSDVLLWNDEESNRGKDRQYDIIVMDNLMPVMNGQDACEQMRRMGYNGIILGLTGNALPKDLAEYRDRGANAVLTKPLVMKEFFAALQ